MSFTKKELIKLMDGLMELASEENKITAVFVGVPCICKISRKGRQKVRGVTEAFRQKKGGVV